MTNYNEPIGDRRELEAPFIAVEDNRAISV